MKVLSKLRTLTSRQWTGISILGCIFGPMFLYLAAMDGFLPTIAFGTSVLTLTALICYAAYLIAGDL